MDVQSRKFFNNKYRWAYSLRIFDVNNLGIWSHRKQTYFISRKRIYKKVFWILLEQAINIIDFEKKKLLSLTKEELKSHQDAKVSYICGKRILKKLSKSINCQKVRDHCHYAGKYRGAAHSICILKFIVPNETSVVFHNNSNYIYHFIIKELANELEVKFECLGENTEIEKVPIAKEVKKIDKDGKESIVTKSYKIKCIDSARFVATSLSNLVDNLTEGIQKIKCKYRHYFLEYESVKDNSIKYKCLSCNKNCSNKIDTELKKRFKNTFKFSNNDIN